jgi:hypothetical protein
MAYLLKARIVEPEEEPLLANGSETTFVSKQSLGKHVPAAMHKHATIKALLETMYSIRSVERGYKEDNWGNRVSSVREFVKKRDNWKRTGSEQPSREDLSAEDEESPLLEAVTRERLVKTRQAGKSLTGAVVICELWRLAVAL